MVSALVRKTDVWSEGSLGELVVLCSDATDKLLVLLVYFRLVEYMAGTGDCG